MYDSRVYFELANFSPKTRSCRHRVLNWANNDRDLLKTVITDAEAGVWLWNQSSQWEQPEELKVKFFFLQFHFIWVASGQWVILPKSYVLVMWVKQVDENAWNCGKITCGNCIIIMLLLTLNCLLVIFGKKQNRYLSSATVSPNTVLCGYFQFLRNDESTILLPLMR